MVPFLEARGLLHEAATPSALDTFHSAILGKRPVDFTANGFAGERRNVAAGRMPQKRRLADMELSPAITVLSAAWRQATMTDEQLAIQAVSDAQRILEEYLQPRPRNNERVILDRLVEVLERPDLLVAVTRMQSGR